jgi:hypothetical protein
MLEGNDSLSDFLNEVTAEKVIEGCECGEDENKDSGCIVKGIYLPLTDTPLVGNFSGLTGWENIIAKSEIRKILGLLDNIRFELESEETDPKLLYLMEDSELKEIDELLYGMFCKIRDFKNKTRLQMKAKLLFEKEAVDLDLSEEELLKILELDSQIDLQKITIENIIKYYPNLVLDNIDKIKEYKNAKKEENRGSSNSGTEFES